MKIIKIKLFQIFFVIIVLNIGIYSNIVSSEIQEINGNKSNHNLSLNDDKDIFIQRVEHYLYIKSEENVQNFIVNYSFPPDYGYQTPILLEIFNDSTANIIKYEIVNELKTFNKLAKFTIENIQKDEIVLIHFTCWVLLFNNDFSDIPDYVKIPEKIEVPEEFIIWLSSSKVVQKNRFLFKYHAQKLIGGGDNLISFADNISSFIKQHRYFLFIIQLNLKIFFSQDAITTLLINGENVGRSHLACALLRTSNVPSRVLLVNNDQGFWTQMHYMVEYYIPNYGWVLIDTTKGETPYNTNKQIINRICYPSDENDTKKDYIIPFMKGEEKWIWINNENIYPYYIDCNDGSKSQMFIEGGINTSSFTAENAFFKTQIVFHQYQKFLGDNLNQENLEHLNNAVTYQKRGINEFIENQDIYEFIYYFDKAYDEYKQIEI
jgi:hypothetical protein